MEANLQEVYEENKPVAGEKFLLVMGGSERGWSRHNDAGIFRDYDAEADRLISSAAPYGLKCLKFNNEFILNSRYYPEHKNILDRISFGFCFKPICFFETLQQVKDGDILLFTDSNHIIHSDPDIYYRIADRYGIFARDHVNIRYLNSQFTRRDTFVTMGCDEERYWNSLQMQCNLIGIKKCAIGEQFAKEWLDMSLNYSAMFGDGKYKNLNDFDGRHRHEQSIFSILVEKYQIPYVNRTRYHELEGPIRELDGIRPANIVDNSFRRNEDQRDNQ